MAIAQRRFGKTGLTVPAVTYGGGWVGGLLIRAERDVREGILERAMTAGIDWIDTAAAYGKGVSETVIGEWLANRGGAKPPRISTKFGVDVTGAAFEDQMLTSVEASLKRLRRDKVEVIYLHNRIIPDDAARPDGRSNTLSEILGPGGAADVMARMRERGLCDFIGITALGDPASLRTVVESGRFDAAQVYYNMLNPSSAEPAGAGWNTTDFNGLLGACDAHGVGTMGIRIFAAGHLATDERHGRELPITANTESSQEEARTAAVFELLGEDYGTRAETALRFGLACDALSTIVVGIGETWHFDQVLAATEAGPLPGDILDKLQALRASHPAFRS